MRRIATLEPLKSLAEALSHPGSLESRLGLPRAARLPVLAALAELERRPILLITDRADAAFSTSDELSLWLPDSPRHLFPEPNPVFYENAPWGVATRKERLQVLTILAAGHLPGIKAIQGSEKSSPPVIIAPARAIMARTLPRMDFIDASMRLEEGQEASPDQLLRSWLSLGYEAATTVLAPGQFARRGGILDIWPPAEDLPSRLDFFGDEIESIRRFDPKTQRSKAARPGAEQRQALITPAREFINSAASPAAGGGTEGESEIDEFLIPILHPTPAGLIDYLPDEALVLIDDWESFHETVNDLEEQAVTLRKDAVQDGRIPQGFPVPYLTWNEIEESLDGRKLITLGPRIQSEPTPLGSVFQSNPRFGGQVKILMDHLVQVHRSGEQAVIVSRQAPRLQELWAEASRPGLETRPPAFIPGSLTEGWKLDPLDGPAVHLLSDGEIFGWRRPQLRYRQRPARETPESHYSDFQSGDWVVHIDHGVGLYKGLVTRTIDAVEREYLCVEYAESDQLFVPVHQADRLTRYVGPDGRTPSPTRLGGIEWRSVRARVKKAVEEVAEDLLELYARRQSVKGHAFSKDIPWQRELEAGFPYIETEDQLRVIDEVKQDMESQQPMDRLVAGDVGYGKTEVALRAAFKAVADDKQVAVLVPTTVLAQQHFHNFRQRLAAFPVEVEMLSRFRTPKEQRDIIERLSEGRIDIVIGTHRLLQSDLEFKDLALLIIDEEQRFGVTHKEHLKKLRTEVDVLTMTATPIPRTLYMALTGVRDISMINTPPEERLPIITHVGPFSKHLIRQAILRELERGGQVFFVHNRVQTIGAIDHQLRQIVPEARISIAHGQMAEHQLADRMEEFSAGQIDVLLTTTIIESGLDIPNANTLIVDRADTFGLAQLYQLRGRVGRGAQRAYAYFFRHKKRSPTLDARQRLETIAENTQLGAGFSIAMRDLEIRGAGDILGTRQHGHIAAVGFHLYTRLLADAVQRLQGSREAPAALRTLAGEMHRPIINVDLPIPVGIPADYIEDQSLRLRLYRRLADIRALDEIDALSEE
ncbi:MAG TPA: transcription-repair coupling factor, partial [Anaerolineales bacterium]|nr:transcription-repair coupling factor [Anaerolineales bacterium]